MDALPRILICLIFLFFCNSSFLTYPLSVCLSPPPSCLLPFLTPPSSYTLPHLPSVIPFLTPSSFLAVHIIFLSPHFRLSFVLFFIIIPSPLSSYSSSPPHLLYHPHCSAFVLIFVFPPPSPLSSTFLLLCPHLNLSSSSFHLPLSSFPLILTHVFPPPLSSSLLVTIDVFHPPRLSPFLHVLIIAFPPRCFPLSPPLLLLSRISLSAACALCSPGCCFHGLQIRRAVGAGAASGLFLVAW